MALPPIDPTSPDALRAWLGRTERRTDVVTAAPLASLAATLDRPEAPEPTTGTPVPPLAHWLYFLPRAPQRELGADGHARRGGFLPPVALPRRVWGGGRLELHHDLIVGDAIVRDSTITRVEAKRGRSGALVLVTVRHEIRDPRGLAIVEDHDIVYRERPAPGAPASPVVAARTDEAFHRVITPDPVWLFRYSALTFNGHRIHYDRGFATDVEGYPGLVVHGPLIATLLLDLLRNLPRDLPLDGVGRERPAARVTRFRFQAMRPLFDGHPFAVCGRREPEGHVALWARDHTGALAMDARAELALDPSPPRGPG